MKISKIVTSLLLGAALSLPMFVQAGSQDDDIVKLVSELADKPEQHQAIAKYYKEQAAEAKQAAEHHRAMKKAYVANVKATGAAASMNAMCDELIASSEAAAKAYSALASEHEKSIKK